MTSVKQANRAVKSLGYQCLINVAAYIPFDIFALNAAPYPIVYALLTVGNACVLGMILYWWKTKQLMKRVKQ